MNILDKLNPPTNVEIRYSLFNYRGTTKASWLIERLEMEQEVRRAVNAWLYSQKDGSSLIG